MQAQVKVAREKKELQDKLDLYSNILPWREVDQAKSQVDEFDTLMYYFYEFNFFFFF